MWQCPPPTVSGLKHEPGALWGCVPRRTVAFWPYVCRYPRAARVVGRASVTAETTSLNSLTSSAEPLTSTWKSGSESSVPSAEKEVLVAAAMFCSGSRSTREEREKERQRRAGGGGRGGGVDQERALAARAGYPLLCQYSMCWGGRAPNPPQKKPR